MAYGLAHIVSYLSQFMSLNPGDVILTGPPPGVGMGQKPQQYLRPGDIVELGIARPRSATPGRYRRPGVNRKIAH